ncbi:MAG: hypothetical protein IH627_18055 [Rubrivivax sp.]|nr:hypothetical protein [Rubrivivax sp.]
MLPPHCVALFDTSGAGAKSDGVRDADPGERPDTASPGLRELPDDTLQALVDLKIFDRVN